MCGISAFFAHKPEPGLAARVERSLDLAAHRGPDGRGIIAGRGSKVLADPQEGPADWVLGHLRLAILDLSPAGAQPMASADGQLWIVYNGEVYNHQALRQELEALGHRFITRTDTEVVLAAYSQWGQAATARLQGMFALVLVDLGARLVLAARDRLGIKPLYLWPGPGGTTLVSEPKQLAAFEGFQAKADRQQVVDFLVDGLVGHEPDRCFFDGVIPLPPACQLVWPLGQAPDPDQRRTYWQPPAQRSNMIWSEAVHRTGELFREAVAGHLVADVAVGSCLSGGVDSSSVVGVAGQLRQGPLHTFSSCSTQARYDEQTYIDAVNAAGGHTPHKVFPDQEGLAAAFDDLVYHQDEPFASLSLYAQWRVMASARQAGVPVLLDGQGGDEALCGYRKYLVFNLRSLMAQRRWGAALTHAANVMLRGDRGLWRLSRGRRYLPGWANREDQSIRSLLRPQWQGLHRRVWQERMAGRPSLRDHQWADMAWWSLPALLRYEDRNSMAHSVEARVPLVDHRFLEHCLSLPDDYFFRRGQSKRVLVEALGPALPPLVAERRSKMGFEVPQALWLRGAAGRMLQGRVAESVRLAEVVDSPRAAQAFTVYAQGRAPYGHWFLVRLASLAAWLERFKVQP